MKRTSLKVFSAIIISVFLFILIANLIPPKKNTENNPFIVGEGKLPMIAAHRGGGDNNPENTMLAFREAVNSYGASIIESDLYLTKDNYLVYNHDGYIDRTSNVNGDISLDEAKALYKNKENRHYISDMTLSQLQEYNFGYYFENEAGERLYKDQTDLKEAGLQIATVDELFSEFYESHPDLLFIVEIKDGGERGFDACKILSDTLDKYPKYRERVVVGSFHDEIEEELKTKYPHLMRGASTSSAIKFILTQFLRVNILDNGDFACLQIPMEYDLGIRISLDKNTIVNRAHRRNIAVQYWTINDPSDMRRLIEMGVDCIMTDNPKLLMQIIDEYKNK